MKSGKRQTTTVLVLASIAGVYLISQSAPVQRQYHLYRFRLSHEDIWQDLPNPSISEVQRRRFEHHRDRLVELGVLFHQTYHVEEIDRVDGARSVFDQILLGLDPGLPPSLLPYWEGAFPSGPVEVWDYAEKKGAWDAFFARHNTPDFAVDHAAEIAAVLANRP